VDTVFTASADGKNLPAGKIVSVGRRPDGNFYRRTSV
jgi:hypothetical protein